jgi:hypothetical protein
MIPLFTSIRPPADASSFAYLAECLDSWRAAGFAPVAVNGPAEAAALRPLDLPVEFAISAADGKPRIGNFLTAIRERSCRFAGIINSDCRIAGHPGLAANLAKQLDGRVVLAWRLDVGDIEPSGVRYGFDAFFFDTAIMPADDAGFCIGDVWWDYWFPLACERRGGSIETLAFPLLTHRVHPLNWKTRKWDDGAHRLWTMLRSWRAAAPAATSVFREIPRAWWNSERLSAHQVGVLSLAVPLWFHKERLQTVAVMPAEMAGMETTFRLCGRALLETSEFTRVRNMIRRAVRPLRMASAVFRRARQAVLMPLSGLGASRRAR